MTATGLDWRLDQREVAIERPHPLSRRLLGGALAGLVATLPMTLAMAALHSRLPPRERHPLPPRHITEKLAEESGLAPKLSEPEMRTLTFAAHFAYGAAAGAAYGLLASLLRGPSVLGGVIFGLGVWAGSYAGWLPAANVLPSAGRESARRNPLMIAAHVVWGAATGALARLASGPRARAVRHET
jgi:uncharacterized membrane protein YagU involved in acid resistance